jgi:Helicase HerA, central domain
MQKFFDEAAEQDHPIRSLKEFLLREEANEKAKKYDALRFVGYVLEIGYDTVTIITSDPYKVNVGGVPRNSVLIMVPAVQWTGMPPHFTVLRVLEAAPTPLSKEVQQTYFELQKKSMPELDVFTQSELQWGALRTAILGMFYPDPYVANAVEFSGDLNNFVSAHNYKVYAPDDDLLDLITNSLVPKEKQFSIGHLRLTENRLPLPGNPPPDVKVKISTRDLMGTRTALFGKTRLGKSNVVKLIAQSLIESTDKERNVGQLIFDINGEYANDNPQDDSHSLRSAYSKRCIVYALTKKEATESKPLRLDFYDHPASSHRIIATLLREAGKTGSNYIDSFLSVDVPSVESVKEMSPGDQLRAKRKVLAYWAILHRAGYPADLAKLKARLGIDPEFNKDVRAKLHGTPPPAPPTVTNLDLLAAEFEKAAEADRVSPLQSSSTPKKDLFDADDRALLGFLKPSSTVSTGPALLQGIRKYHDPKAGDFITEILGLLDKGDTVILDLGNAPPEVMNYFSEHLSRSIFTHQVDKFSNNKLGDKFIQLFFEEAHNLFPTDEKAAIDIYRRIAKEGAKYHIGMVYATQSVTSINRDLLAQTENFFVAHMSSKEQVDALARINVEFDSLKDDIMRAKTPGYIRMLTKSHRFVISMQADRFSPVAALKK